MFLVVLNPQLGTTALASSAIADALRVAMPDASADMIAQVADRSTGVTLDAWVRLDNRETLAATLGHGTARRTAAADAELVLAGYLRWGSNCVDRMEGDFAFVVKDPRDGSAFAARDAVGIRPLYYAVTPELFAASPTAALFDIVAGVDTSVASGWLADFIHGRSSDYRSTPLSGVRKLPPGHCLTVTAQGVQERCYHRFAAESVWEDTRDRRWLDAYRDELIRAVSLRTEPTGLIGVESSGGIDSSTILGTMAHTHPEVVGAIHTFGFARFEREPEFILETSVAHGIVNNHILTHAEPPVGAAQRGWRAIGYPAEHNNAVAHIPFYALASQLGVTALHSGHGGDELVTNTGQLALAELLAHRRWAQAMRDLPGPNWRRPARLAKQWARRPGEVSHLTEPMMSRLRPTPLHADVFTERDLAGRTFQAAKHSAPYSRVNDFLLGDRLSAMTSIRTAECSLVAASHGIDYRWALLDRRLIAQYLATPAVWKFGEGHSRYLHRRAIAGMVPDKVAWNRSKDMGELRGPWLRQDHPTHPGAGATGFAGESAESLLEPIHPQVAGLLDTTRVARLLDPAEVHTRVANRYLTRIRALSDWLHDRVRA